MKRPELETFVGFCGPRKTEESHRVLSGERGQSSLTNKMLNSQAGGDEKNEAKMRWDRRREWSRLANCGRT